MKHSTGPTGNSEFCFPVTFNGILRLLRETLIDHIKDNIGMCRQCNPQVHMKMTNWIYM